MMSAASEGRRIPGRGSFQSDRKEGGDLSPLALGLQIFVLSSDFRLQQVVESLV